MIFTSYTLNMGLLLAQVIAALVCVFLVARKGKGLPKGKALAGTVLILLSALADFGATIAIFILRYSQALIFVSQVTQFFTTFFLFLGIILLTVAYVQLSDEVTSYSPPVVSNFLPQQPVQPSGPSAPQSSAQQSSAPQRSQTPAPQPGTNETPSSQSGYAEPRFQDPPQNNQSE